MKKALLVSALVAMLVAPAMAGPVTFRWYVGSSYKTFTTNAQVDLTNYSPEGGGLGGAFWVNLDSGTLSYSNGTAMVTKTAPPKQSNLFTTYCLENGITFGWGPSNIYYATVDRNAYSGNAGIGGDTVSNVTEYIYDRWLKGVYGTGADNVDNDGVYDQQEINQAIWFAEGELGSITGDALALYNGALAAVGGKADATHTHALNLWTLKQGTVGDYTGWLATDIQSQLISVPVPGAALLGLLGLSIVGWVKRRMA
jgi:hypothetical protein